MLLGYLAISQQGTMISLPEKEHPRKQLLEKLGSKHAAKMYVDNKDGEAKHVGYIVRGEWFTIYEVHHWQGKA